MALAHWKFIAPANGRQEAAGISFESNVIRDFIAYGRNFYPDVVDEICDVYCNLSDESSRYIIASEMDDKSVDVSEFDCDDDPAYVNYVSALNPTMWKECDPYQVLGLSKLRHRATLAQIRCSYRRKVLKFHPDKRMAVSNEQSDVIISQDAFACITRAYEALSCLATRRAYDSVDEAFDNTVPPINNLSRENFYTIFGDAFRRNARWSLNVPVPELGGPEDSKEKVNAFYNFWYDFSSWRVFTWHMEEDPSKGECREERRWIAKSMKASHEPLRKDEMKRIRLLVDNAYKCDPRIEQFKLDEKQRRQAAKEQKRLVKIQAHQEAAHQKELEERRERERKAEEERKEKEKLIEDKRQKLAIKKTLQKERKSLCDFVESKDYFLTIDDERLSVMENLGRLCNILPMQQLQNLNNALKSAQSLQNARQTFERALNEMNAICMEEKLRNQCAIDSSLNGCSRPADAREEVVWSKEETQLLVRAVTVYPAGTKQRWNLIADFINTHRKCADGIALKTDKQVISMLKTLEKTSVACAKQTIANENPLQAKGDAEVNVAPSLRFTSGHASSAPWSADEQKRLEEALKQYPPKVQNRWDLIANHLPERGKQECIRRYKEIAELVKAKKAALQNSHQ